MARILIALVIIALWIYTLIDCVRTPAAATPARIPKLAWIALIFFVPVIGPVLWLYFKYQSVLASDTPLRASDISEKFRKRSTRPSAPLAPDDDPEFLARLDAQNRRKAYEQRKAEEELKKKKAKDAQENSEPPEDLPPAHQ